MVNKSKRKLLFSLLLHGSLVAFTESIVYYSRADPIVPFADSMETDSTAVKVQFYGESQCPFCRKFVTETWNEIWNDADLKAHIDYEFVPWGNAYFATVECGKGPYDPKERACFYDHCITNSGHTFDSSTPDDDCFSGEPVYQHSQKEGQGESSKNMVKARCRGA
jgi:Gamma interferon inducible lysosomal thiol reductase (GILT)